MDRKDVEIEKITELENENIATREFKKPISLILLVIAVSMSMFHLYTGAFGVFTAMIQAGVHLAFALALIFLLFPATKKSPRVKLPIYDILLSIAGFSVGLYVVLNYGEILAREGSATPLEIVLGVVATLLVLEATRRTLGLSMVILSFLFILYAYFGAYIPGELGHRGYSVERIAYQMYLTTSGIFATPLVVSATIIAMFVLFGAFLNRSGAGKYFMDIAMGLTGRTRGGPAKAAVVGSCLMGTVSGSAVANAVTVGTFTIPLMIRGGYKRDIASAIEAVASTGGQIMPPVMGAVAFVMAELTNIPYINICIAAALPAILYFFSLFMVIHFEALKFGLKGLSGSQLPDVKKALFESIHLFIPLLLLVYLLIKGYSPMYVAFRVIVLLLIISMIRKATRMNLKNIITSLEDGARSVLGVAAACASGGIIIGVITLTGLGVKLSSWLVDISGGSLFILLILTMLSSLVLGLGLPTVACYVLLAALVAPAIVSSGISVMAAHLFILYYGIISAITPPVALAAYATSGISGSNPNRVGWIACWIGLISYVVPFMFVYGPGLLMEGPILECLKAAITSIIGCVAIAGGIVGHILRKCLLVERILLLGAGLLLINTLLITDIIGISIFIVILAFQWILRKNQLIIENYNI
jgi:TRAP transporter 4TM/12TM fusion protein